MNTNKQHTALQIINTKEHKFELTTHCIANHEHEIIQSNVKRKRELKHIAMQIINTKERDAL